jgi:hypothetical protein
MTTDPLEWVDAQDVLRDYFIVTKRRRLRKIEADFVEPVFAGIEQIPNFGFGEISVVSVVRDEAIPFAGCYFLKAGVLEGYVAGDSLTMHGQHCYLEGMRSLHGLQVSDEQWDYVDFPADSRAQIAKALRVQESQVHDLGVGGPLLVAHMFRMAASAAAQMLAQYQFTNRRDLASPRRQANAEARRYLRSRA